MHTGLVKNGVRCCIKYINGLVFQHVNGWNVYV